MPQLLLILLTRYPLTLVLFMLRLLFPVTAVALRKVLFLFLMMLLCCMTTTILEQLGMIRHDQSRVLSEFTQTEDFGATVDTDDLRSVIMPV